MAGLLNTKQCAEYIGVTVRTIYRWIEAEKIPYMKAEFGYRFDIEELKEWMKGGRKA